MCINLSSEGFGIHNTDTSAFIANSFYEDNGRILPLKSDDLSPRLASPNGDIVFTTFIPSPRTQATKTASAAESSNFEYIDQVSKIGNYALYIHRSGLIVWDDETVTNSNVNAQTQIVANF